MMLNCDQNYVPYYALCAALLTELTKKEGQRINYTKQLETQVKELTESLKNEKELTSDLQDKLSKAITRDVYMQIIDELKGAKGRVIIYQFPEMLFYFCNNRQLCFLKKIKD